MVEFSGVISAIAKESHKKQNSGCITTTAFAPYPSFFKQRITKMQGKHEGRKIEINHDL